MESARATKVKCRQVMQLQRRSRKKTRKEYVGRDIKLTKEEVNVMKNGWMLTDRHITVANQMLRKQFPEVRGL